MDHELKKQIDRQLRFQNHSTHCINIKIKDRIIINDFIIEKDVFSPVNMTAMILAEWLYCNPQLYKNKKVLDIGCGTGLQGIIMGINGAKSITFSDISINAVENTKKNISKAGLQEKSDAIESDLFENIEDKFDIIVFNHPFLVERYDIKKIVDLNRPKDQMLLHKFLKDARRFLKEKGKIIMPYFHIAGKNNDPGIQAKEYDYRIKEVLNTENKIGIQTGRISIYEIS